MTKPDCQSTPELLGEDQNNKEEASRSRGETNPPNPAKVERSTSARNAAWRTSALSSIRTLFALPPSPHRGRRRSRQKGLSMTDRPDIHHDLHGCAGEPFPETTADGAEPTEATYLERVTLPEREQAVARLVEESGFSAEAHRGLRPIYMRWTEGEAMAWIECAADHPEAVPFWKDDQYA